MMATLLAVAWLASVPAASAVVLHVDSEHSSARFSVRVLWFRVLDGRMGDIHGTVSTSDAGLRVAVTVDTTTLHMDDPAHAAELRSATFLDVEHFPDMRFVSQPFERALLARGGPVDGRITLHGITRPITLVLEPSSCDLRQPDTCHLQAHGSILRSHFGMTAHSFAVSDTVKLALDIRLEAP